MRRAIKILLGVAAGCALLAFGLLVLVALVADAPVLIKRVSSPLGAVTAAHYVIGEGEDPPYGDEVRLEFKQTGFFRKSVPVFRGYCGPLSLTWRTATGLLVSCERIENVRLQSPSTDGISIEVTIITPKPAP